MQLAIYCTKSEFHTNSPGDQQTEGNAAQRLMKRYLEIRDVGTGRVVTVMEVLSPKNKRAGEEALKYDTKRQKILNSTAYLVEIDLL